VAVIVLFLLPIPLNIVVDPFKIFGGELTPCFVRHADGATFQRMSIVHEAERADPELVVVGSSRVAHLDVELIEELSGLPSYVFSVAGANFYEIRRHFEHYVARKPIKKALVGLDYFMFNPRRRPLAGFDELRLQGGPPPWKDLAVAATHHKALLASAGVLRACFQDWSSGAATESRHDTIPVARAEEGERLDGAIAYATNADMYATDTYRDFGRIAAQLDDLRLMIEIAAREGIELQFFLNPVYYKHWYFIYALGLGASFERWVEEVVRLVPVWAFIGKNSVTTERERFSDTSHYDPVAGRLMLRRMLDDDAEGVPDDFGILLTPDNVEETLAANAAAIEPRIIDELLALIGD